MALRCDRRDVGVPLHVHVLDGSEKSDRPERSGHVLLARRDLFDEPAAVKPDAHSCVPPDYVCRFRLRFTDKSWQLCAVACRSFRKTPRVTSSRRSVGDALHDCLFPPAPRFAQRSGYRFVITANGKIDIASASFTRRSCTGIGRQVKRSCACANGSVSGSSTIVSFQLSPIGGKPI